ncbi:MAG: hypothetical protein FWG74_07050 [Planctomycetes bacterium]|nr:hypothetical protein [Planctomycetota bacterium]
MPMDLFRRKQKIIFWIVTIIIVPSFLVWGYYFRAMDYTGQQLDFEVGKIRGKGIPYHEFEAFRKRIQAAIGGVPFQFVGAPGFGTASEELWKYLLSYALLKDAEEAGARVPDIQVGTYIERMHPILAGIRQSGDPKALDLAVDNLCRQMQISRQDFLRGVREWQTIGNYLVADANLAAISDDTTFVFYSINHSELAVKRIRIVETDDIRNQAKHEIMERPAADLERDIRAYASTHSYRQPYRTPAGWRFAFVLTPFVPESTIRQPTEEEIDFEYQLNNDSLLEQPQDEARENIKADLIRQEIERQTIRNLTIDVDPQLHGPGRDLYLSELVKLTPLAKHGVTAGDTGPELLSAAEVMQKLPAGAPPRLKIELDSLDQENPAIRDANIKEWLSEYISSNEPLRSDAGFFRLRLMEYQPSLPIPVDNPDGSINTEIYEQVLVDMVGDRVTEIVVEKARDEADMLRSILAAKEKGETPPDEESAAEFAALPEENIPYLQIPDEDYELVRLTVGDMMGPRPFADFDTGVSGQELLAVVERRLPSRADFEAEPPETKSLFRQTTARYFRSNFGFNFTMNGPVAIIQPGPAIMGGLVDQLNRGETGVNPELLRYNQTEG